MQNLLTDLGISDCPTNFSLSWFGLRAALHIWALKPTHDKLKFVGHLLELQRLTFLKERRPGIALFRQQFRNIPDREVRNLHALFDLFPC